LFLINTVSYVAVILALLAMKLLERPAASAKAISIAASMFEGGRYTLATTPIRDLLILLGVVGFMGMPYMTLMPIFAANVHKSGADALGLMFGAVGLGALIGALFLAQRKILSDSAASLWSPLWPSASDSLSSRSRARFGFHC
jgi:hypothetical protein